MPLALMPTEADADCSTVPTGASRALTYDIPNERLLRTPLPLDGNEIVPASERAHVIASTIRPAARADRARAATIPIWRTIDTDTRSTRVSCIRSLPYSLVALLQLMSRSAASSTFDDAVCKSSTQWPSTD